MINSPEATARKAYDTWHARMGRDEECTSHWHRLVKQHLRPDRDLVDRTILEIGCGRGEFARWLAQHPARPRGVVAADFSPTAISIARAVQVVRASASIHWLVADIQSIPCEDASFDTVVSCETIEHVPDPARAVRELVRVLRPGGVLFLTTPNYMGPFGAYRIYRRLAGRPYTEADQPINNFVMLPRTTHWLRAAGATITVVDSAQHVLLFPGRPPVHLNPPEAWHPITRWLVCNLASSQRVSPDN